MDVGYWTLAFGIISFFAGRIIVQSENVVLKKREIYQGYLNKCITAHDAYKQGDPGVLAITIENLAPTGEFFLYAAQDVIILAGRHVESIGAAFDQIDRESEALHPAFTASIRAYNSMLASMRRDVLGFSIQGISERLIGSPRAKRLSK